MTQQLTRVYKFEFVHVINVALLISVAHIYGQTQAEMNAEARSDFARADADLNKTYQTVLAKLPIAEKQKLKEAQRAWVASRDGEAARAAKKADGGSMTPTIRYETMTDLTRKRITELKAMSDKGITSSPPTQAAQSPNDQASSGSESDSTPDSTSPDKRWEYTCEQYGIGQCAPEIVNAATSDVVLNLEDDVNGPEARAARVVWAPNSKRFAFNYSPPHAHHTQYVTVAFYQLQGDKWVQLAAPLRPTDQPHLLELSKKHLLKHFDARTCSPERDILKLRSWVDNDTATLYAPCYDRKSGDLNTAFVLTVKFDAQGNSKLIKAEKLSGKEAEAE
jgi:uncharacterized protein YecT (DUF1311 family)